MKIGTNTSYPHGLHLQFCLLPCSQSALVKFFGSELGVHWAVECVLCINRCHERCVSWSLFNCSFFFFARILTVVVDDQTKSIFAKVV